MYRKLKLSITNFKIMHQSIPAVPIPPPGNRGAFAHVASPGGGAFAILSRPRGLGFSVPRGDPPGIWHTRFRKMSLSGRTRPLSKTVHQGLEKLVGVSVKDTTQKAVDWSPRRREERKWYNQIFARYFGLKNKPSTEAKRKWVQNDRYI